MRSIMDTVHREQGSLDIFLNNAGIGIPEYPFHTTKERDIDRLIAINATALTFNAQYAIQHMIENRKGVIINTASMGGIYAMAYSPVYSATKHFTIGLSR